MAFVLEPLEAQKHNVCCPPNSSWAGRRTPFDLGIIEGDWFYVQHNEITNRSSTSCFALATEQ